VLDKNVGIFNSLFKAIQIKRAESDLQSLTKVLNHQKPFQIFLQKLRIFMHISTKIVISKQ